MSRFSRAGALFAIALLPIACSSQRTVTRIDPNTVTDLSGRWNDTDSRLVANELIHSSLTEAWLRNYREANAGNAPVIIVGTFRNSTLEHIAVNTFVNDLERAFVNSGAVRVVASPDERSEIRDERYDQQQHATAATRARWAQETGARYMLQGDIQAIEDRDRGERVVFYQVDAQLVDLQSNEKVWTGQHKQKKFIERSRVRMD